MRGIGVIVLCIASVAIPIDGAVVNSGYKNWEDDAKIQEEAKNRNLEDFYAEREAILAAEASEFLGADEVLAEDEKRARDVLQAIKVAEFNAGFNASIFPPAKSFFQSQEEIESSSLFAQMRLMPKGGVLHVHEFGMASAEWVVNDLSYREHFCMCDRGGIEDVSFGWFTDPENITDCQWRRLSDLREEFGAAAVDDYLKDIFVINVDDPAEEYPDLNSVWQRFQSVMVTTGSAASHVAAFTDYMTRAFEEFYTDNVQYIEVRSTLPDTICRNMESDNCDLLTSAEVAQLFVDVAVNFESAHTDFCGIKYIYAPVRKVTKQTVEEYLLLASELMETHPDRFVGFDLVGQEDMGEPLINFAEHIIAAKERSPKLRFFFHAGETDWQGSSTDINIIDALLLGAERIGHGYAIAKHPEAIRIARERDVPLEVCPISNQVLGLLGDLRNHPAAALIQQGHPIVISSDDPASWNIKGGVSHDYYEAFMGLASRDMDIRLLKRLVFNTVRYSAMNEAAKGSCNALVQEKWNDFIGQLLQQQRETEEQRILQNTINDDVVNIQIMS